MVGNTGGNDAPRAHRYYPGLDGLRALAVIAVLFFHAGARNAVGGFLGVSLFFTLSGFLITGLLIDELSSSGRIRVRAFWGRRIRRLMPAAVVCLGLVLVLSPWLVEAVTVVRLRADVVAAAADVANWRFVTAHQSYAELFARQPSAVLHFWSLAIEEQFYIVYPCLIALLARFGRRRTWILPLGLVAMIAVSIMSSLLATSHDLIYYGTHTRAAELLIGGLLAWFVQRASAGRGTRRFAALAARHVAVAQMIAFAALGGFVILVMRTEQSAEWLYRGGFALLGLLWCVLILAARAPGALGTLVSQRPLVAIGRRSYGIYLFHWPVFTLITPARLGVHGWPARLIQLLIVATITELSYRLIERPIRLRRVLTDRLIGPAVAIACISAVIAAAVILPGPTTTSAGSMANLAAIPDAVVHLSASPSPFPSPSPSLSPAAPAAAGATIAVSGGDGPAASSTPTVAARAASVSPEPSAVAPTVRVTVIGSEPAVAASVEAVASMASALVVAVADETVDGCSVVSATKDAVGDGSCMPDSRDRTLPPDVVVIGVGRADHAEIQSVLAPMPGETGPEQFTVAQDLMTHGVAELSRLGRLAPTVVIVDARSRSATPDVLDQMIDEAVLSTPTMHRAALADLDLAKIAGTSSATAAAVPALKIMVIGDSTSYGFAKALASSPGQSFDVLWAGKRNCPVARMDAIRWLTGDEFSMADCPSITSVWPEQIATFRPDVILVVDGLPEESLQKYPGDDAWHEAGDPAFNEIHRADARGLLDLAATVGAVVVLADQPHDAPDTSSVWATASRIDAWNALLHAWDQVWAPVAVLPYGPAVEAAEAASGHSLRPDGLHLDPASDDAIVGGTLAPLLAAQVRDLRVALDASGCRLPTPAGATLDLTDCH